MTADKLGAAAVFCVDTNLLVEFSALADIPWRELTPGVAEVRIVVPTKVAEEMDAHKKKSGRLRRRGLEFGIIARQIEESVSGTAILRDEGPRVSIEFGPIFRRSQLDADLYDLDDPDGRVVAEVAAIRAERPEVTLLADDSKPIRLAKTTGIPQARPPASWRRSEGPDERDIEISELRKEVGARPVLKVSFPDEVDDKHRHVIEPAPLVTDPECVAAFRRIARLADPHVPRQETIAKHGLRKSDPFGLTTSTIFGAGIREDDLAEYDQEYGRFANMVDQMAERLPTIFEIHGLVLPLAIAVGNDGDRAAERVHVEAELGGAGLRFLPPDAVASDIKRYFAPPRPPKPSDPLANLRPVNFDPPKPRRSDIFFDQDTASLTGDNNYVSWRCEELRQGVHYELPVLIEADKSAQSGALTVTVGSAVLAKKVTLIAPIVVAHEPSKVASASYLLRRLDLLPKRYRKLLRPELEALAARRD